MRHVILGGSGTLGREIARQLLAQDHAPVVTIFSRDELKQKEMARDFGNHPKLHFVLGDIRDYEAVSRVLRGAQVAYAVAALKHVDTLELNPEESIKTNIQGTVNVANAAEANWVPHVIFSSTDKAVAPINTYGMCKAISERLLLRRNETQTRTRFSVYRWGNVASSRGSVIPIFLEALKKGQPVNITDPEMTRFLIRISDAVKFMLSTYSRAHTDQAMIPPMKAARVMDLLDAAADSMGIDEFETQVTGIRPGEKIHEEIEPGVRSDSVTRFSHEELIALVREHASKVAA